MNSSIISTGSCTNKLVGHIGEIGCRLWAEECNNDLGWAQIRSEETRINILLECDGGVGNQIFFRYPLLFLLHR